MPKNVVSTNAMCEWAFTYFPPNNLDIALSTHQPIIHGILKTLCKKFIYQLERCPKTGSLHYQGYLNLKVKKRKGELGNLLSGLGMKGVEPSIASNAGRTALKCYCMKTQTRVSGPWADHRIYMGQDLIVALRPWQQNIVQMLNTTPHRRKIYWYNDNKGGYGKTSLSKYLWFHHKVLTITVGKVSDILNVVMKFQNKPMYIFDISRTVPAGIMTEIYCALEMVKNGYFINTKYETGVVCMEIPHVIVFSNYLPKLSALSLDKWQIIDMCQMCQEN